VGDVSWFMGVSLRSSIFIHHLLPLCLHFGPILTTSLLLGCLWKAPISEQSSVLKFWVLGLRHIFVGGGSQLTPQFLLRVELECTVFILGLQLCCKVWLEIKFCHKCNEPLEQAAHMEVCILKVPRILLGSRERRRHSQQKE
jgi:hypothetical protein